MIWILLLYVLPFIVCCVLGYYMSKTNGETMKDYLNGVLFCLIPVFNILFIVMIVGENIRSNKSIQDFLNKKL